MHKKSIQELQEEYELELNKVIKTIKNNKAKLVLLQFPDGLKPNAIVIADELEKRLRKDKTKSQILIWLGSCFGACDVPLQVKNLGVDLIIQFGHSAWQYKNKEIKVLK